MEWIERLLFVVGYAVVVVSFIPLIRTNHWYVRIFDYPRFQKFWLNLAILCASPFTLDFSTTHATIFVTALVLNQLYLFSLIWNYTPLAKIQMKRRDVSHKNRVRLLISNVFQDNHNYKSILQLITERSPDIVLLVETDQRWMDELKSLWKDYPFRVLQPLDNTYGMMLLSKFEVLEHHVRYLVEGDVPSIKADLKSKDGHVFRLFCLHPKPPVPSESAESTERDAEILIVGKEAKRSKIPVIVAGDLNDVAWSYTTNLFLKVSGLLDPRIGRGFFSTFHAHHALFRWPLDHVFCSSHFYLGELRRLRDVGSDHFPIYIEVFLMPQEMKENKEEEKQASTEEKKLADEKIEEAL